MQEVYLAHHGILGQKWGIRRYQNADGSYTAEGKKRYLNSDGSMNEKGRKLYWKQHRNDMFNDVGHYEAEYDTTKEGSKKLKNYQDEIEKYENDPETYNDWKNFDKVERNYLNSQAKYTGQKMLEKYGTEKLSILMDRGGRYSYVVGEDIVKDYVTYYGHTHAY